MILLTRDPKRKNCTDFRKTAGTKCEHAHAHARPRGPAPAYLCSAGSAPRWASSSTLSCFSCTTGTWGGEIGSYGSEEMWLLSGDFPGLMLQHMKCETVFPGLTSAHPTHRHWLAGYFSHFREQKLTLSIRKKSPQILWTINRFHLSQLKILSATINTQHNLIFFKKMNKSHQWPLIYAFIIIASLVAQTVKCLPTTWETRVRFLDWEDPLEKEMATRSSAFAWKIPWTEDTGRLQSMGSQRVGHDWATSLSHFHYIHTYFTFTLSIG